MPRLNDADATAAAVAALATRAADYPRLETIRRYAAGVADPVYIPKDARQEFKWIADRARVNVLPLVVDTIAQCLYVDGYRPSEGLDGAALWRHWVRNRMNARQTGVHRAALTYGASYLMIVPGEPVPVWRAFSPRRLTCVYADAVADEWPQFALEINTGGEDGSLTARLWAPYWVWDFTLADINAKPAMLSVSEHGIPHTPVVRFANCADPDGDLVGEIAPLIPLQDQINLTTFNLLIAQNFAAFKQKWVTGLEIPRDAQGREVEPFKSAVNRVFVGEGEGTRFGEFGATDLGGYLDSRESAMRNLATISQVPPHHLIGQMANLSAEALAAAEVQQTRKVSERKSLLGESWEQSLRLSALVAGDLGNANDVGGTVVWRDTEARSLSATADALGKLTQMLNVPPQELWARVPGVTVEEVERWKRAAESDDSLAALTDELMRQADGANPPG